MATLAIAHCKTQVTTQAIGAVAEQLAVGALLEGLSETAALGDIGQIVESPAQVVAGQIVVTDRSANGLKKVFKHEKYD